MITKSFVVIAAFLIISCQPVKKITGNAPASFDQQGHRGARGLMPENTIAAMYKAIDLKVTTLEMDVVISKDLQVVVSHDPHFNEHITTTPEGKFLTKAEAAQRLLFNMNYDSIRRYDVGMKPHPDFPRQQKIHAYKPLLKDLLDSTEAYARKQGRTIAYNIEIKSKPEGDGVKHPPVEQFADLLVSVILEKGLEKRTTIQSFDPRALQAVHVNHPNLVTSLLIENNNKQGLETQLQQLGYTPQVYSPHYSLVTPELVRACHDKKIAVIPWTINNAAEMKRQVQLGVDGIITDYPDLFAQL
jgi:glycerophosphoryl diester phosphodiesterase